MPEDGNLKKWYALEADITTCRICPRLVAWREEVATNRRRAYRDWEYWGKPVPGFGDHHARLLVVGLAPGAHGSNRTGRMFTGDASGDFLYRALWKTGFANRSAAINRDDDLQLIDVFITAVGRCAPPDNRPTPQELDSCRHFLLAEIDLLKHVQGVIALGAIAFEQLLGIYRAQGAAVGRPTFQHGQYVQLGEGHPWMLASYHPSRQNTQTGRLTMEMFDGIWLRARQLLDASEVPSGKDINTDSQCGE